MDSSQVGVLKQTNKVSLSSLLEGKHSRALETQISLEVLRNFTNQALERQLADQELGRLLILADLTKSDGTGPVSVRLLDTPCNTEPFTITFVATFTTTIRRRIGSTYFRHSRQE
jgi:hypothetical protein